MSLGAIHLSPRPLPPLLADDPSGLGWDRVLKEQGERECWGGKALLPPPGCVVLLGGVDSLV